MSRKSITVKVLNRSTGTWASGKGSTVGDATVNAFTNGERKPSKSVKEAGKIPRLDARER